MIEFDTFPNKEWDPDVQHVGINSDSIGSAVFSSWKATSHSGEPADVWISYNATTKSLSAFWTYEQNHVFTGQISLSYQIDLTKILPEFVTIGFSAATGD
ncbi:hypothetical protein NL676_016650 [Syzygium grande]|nr:hypothetical protein NL676_016650 [Syzygium grande]